MVWGYSWVDPDVDILAQLLHPLRPHLFTLRRNLPSLASRVGSEVMPVPLGASLSRTSTFGDLACTSEVPELPTQQISASEWYGITDSPKLNNLIPGFFGTYFSREISQRRNKIGLSSLLTGFLAEVSPTEVHNNASSFSEYEA